MKLPMIIVLVAFLGINYLKADEEKTITLKDLQGRELLCEIVTKTNSSVTVTSTNGQEFEIPLDKLDSKSRSLIADWSDPALKLFELLNSSIVTTNVRADENFKTSMLYWNFAKEYGTYTEFGEEGVPECKLSFASLLFAFQDLSKDKITGQMVLAYFSPVDLSASIPRGTKGIHFAKLLSDTIQEWPAGLPYYTLEDFRNLQRALYKNQKDMVKRINDYSDSKYCGRIEWEGLDAIRGKFYISPDVRKYSKRIVNVLKPYQNKLGLPY